MAKTGLGMSKRTLVQALGGCAALFGVTGVVLLRALGATYGVPSSPHTTQLLRLFGSRMLALAPWTFTAQTNRRPIGCRPSRRDESPRRADRAYSGAGHG
jgi:hypothetical protein